MDTGTSLNTAPSADAEILNGLIGAIHFIGPEWLVSGPEWLVSGQEWLAGIVFYRI